MQANSPGSSTLFGRVSARLKLAVTLLLILAVVLLPRRPHWAYIIPLALLLIAWAATRMPVLPALRRLLIVEFFILGMGLLTLLSPNTLPIFLAAVIKSNLSVLAILLLTWTTSFHEILHELRRLRLPSVMLTTLALMWRYFPVLAEETRRMQRARASRTFQHSRRRAWHNLGQIAGQLFVRSAQRADRIYSAMCARGWK